MRTKFNEAQLEEISNLQKQDGTTRKAAVRKYRRLQKLAAKALKNVEDVQAKKTRKPPAKNASAVAKGAAYHILAGRPSKDAVIECFGKSGYALSWVSRAERLGITAQELCEQFSRDAAQVKEQWAALATKKEAAGAA